MVYRGDPAFVVQLVVVGALRLLHASALEVNGVGDLPADTLIIRTSQLHEKDFPSPRGARGSARR
jgi:hypothetical protein